MLVFSQLCLLARIQSKEMAVRVKFTGLFRFISCVYIDLKIMECSTVCLSNIVLMSINNFLPLTSHYHNNVNDITPVFKLLVIQIKWYS